VPDGSPFQTKRLTLGARIVNSSSSTRTAVSASDRPGLAKSNRSRAISTPRAGPARRPLLVDGAAPARTGDTGAAAVRGRASPPVRSLGTQRARAVGVDLPAGMGGQTADRGCHPLTAYSPISLSQRFAATRTAGSSISQLIGQSQEHQQQPTTKTDRSNKTGFCHWACARPLSCQSLPGHGLRSKTDLKENSPQGGRFGHYTPRMTPF
jgi:hypothetical protein